MRATFVVVPLLAVAAATLNPSAVAAKPSQRCNHHPAYRKDRVALLFRVHTDQDDGYGHRLIAYYVCGRPNGQPVQLAVNSANETSEYPRNDQLTELRLAGSYAGALVIVGQGAEQACLKLQSNCPAPHLELTLVDAATRSKARLVPDIEPEHLTLSPAGAAAWLVPQGPGTQQLMATTLHPQGRRLLVSPQLLDTGAITDVRWSGRKISWRHSGAPRSATLNRR